MSAEEGPPIPACIKDCDWGSPGSKNCPKDTCDTSSCDDASETKAYFDAYFANDCVHVEPGPPACIEDCDWGSPGSENCPKDTCDTSSCHPDHIAYLDAYFANDCVEPIQCRTPDGAALALAASAAAREVTYNSECIKDCPVPNILIPLPECFEHGEGTAYPIVDRSSGLRKLVDDWIAGGTTRANVESKYGPIQDWDTSKVTSMYYLFHYRKTFDADLSKWNVARVTSMINSTFQLPLFNLNSLFTTCFLFLPLSLLARILFILRFKKIIKNSLTHHFWLLYSFYSRSTTCFLFLPLSLLARIFIFITD